jgi:hypothetical protein
MPTAEPYGDCVLERWTWPGGDWLWVHQADPLVLIDPPLLADVRHVSPHPAVTLRDDVLTIRGQNRTVVYVIGRYIPERGMYEARWPD